ncbi:MAG: stage V sporulation protein AC [Eubacteriales bacterium]|nr:stage V sporulation protein AC [Eubacteriales bacterium]
MNHQSMDRETYRRFADAHAPKSPVLRNCARAFWVGGLICVIGQALRELYSRSAHLNPADTATMTSVTLIFIAALLSGIGIFDRIAKYAGAGTLVPITGFANAVVSPAIDSHAEGLILGVGAKIFTVAGPVLLYGTLAGGIWGVVYYGITCLF